MPSLILILDPAELGGPVFFTLILPLEEPNLSALLITLFHNPRASNLGRIHRPILSPSPHKPHSLHDPQPTRDPRKDRMFPIQPRCRCKRNTMFIISLSSILTETGCTDKN